VPFDLCLRRGDQMVWGEAELLLQFLERRGRPERVHPDDRAASADVAVPAEGRRLFDRHTREHVRRQYLSREQAFRSVPGLWHFVLVVVVDLVDRHDDARKDIQNVPADSLVVPGRQHERRDGGCIVVAASDAPK